MTAASDRSDAVLAALARAENRYGPRPGSVDIYYVLRDAGSPITWDMLQRTLTDLRRRGVIGNWDGNAGSRYWTRVEG